MQGRQLSPAAPASVTTRFTLVKPFQAARVVMLFNPLEAWAKGIDLWSLSYERRNPEPCFTICAGAPCLTRA